jgi:hypothetical protein
MLPCSIAADRAGSDQGARVVRSGRLHWVRAGCHLLMPFEPVRRMNLTSNVGFSDHQLPGASHTSWLKAADFGAHSLRAGFLTRASARRGVPKAEGWTDRLTSWSLSLPIIANDHLKDA